MVKDETVETMILPEVEQIWAWEQEIKQMWQNQRDYKNRKNIYVYPSPYLVEHPNMGVFGLRQVYLYVQECWYGPMHMQVADTEEEGTRELLGAEQKWQRN